jgi:hypothetical protein
MTSGIGMAGDGQATVTRRFELGRERYEACEIARVHKTMMKCVTQQFRTCKALGSTNVRSRHAD